MSNSHIVILLLIFCVSTACNKEEENPLKGLSSGIWIPTELAQIGLIPIGGDSIQYHDAPIWITDSNELTINHYRSVENGLKVIQDTEGNWRIRFFSNQELLINSNENKDTLTLFSNSKNGAKTIKYTFLLKNPEFNISIDSLKKGLRGTTWNTNTSIHNKILFHNDSLRPKGSLATISTKILTVNDTSDIQELSSFVILKKLKGFIFLEFTSPSLNTSEIFVLKNINIDKTILELIPLKKQLYDSTLVLKKELQDIPYVDSLRKSYQVATKANTELN